LAVATWKGLPTVPSPPAYALDAEHAVAVAGLASIATIPVANKPAIRTGTASVDMSFEERLDNMGHLFLILELLLLGKS
jgi:hypothetical protein